MDKFQKKIQAWSNKLLSFVGKVVVVTKSLQTCHVYYSSYWIPNVSQYMHLEKIIRSFLWYNLDGSKNLPLIAWK